MCLNVSLGPNMYRCNINERLDVTKIGVIVTDGKSNVDDDYTIANAEAARGEDIRIFSIGVTNSTDEEELKHMSSEPQELNQNYFRSPTFKALEDIQSVVTSRLVRK